MGGFTELDGVVDVEIVQISGRTYAVIAAWTDSGVQVIDMTDPAAPVPVAAITDGVGGFTELGGAEAVAITQIFAKTYAVVAAISDDGVQIIDVSDPAAPVPVAAITDGFDGFTELDGARGVTTPQIFAKAYAIVAARDDDGVQVIDMSDPAAPVPVAAITDGVGGFTELEGANGIATTQISGRTYAVVAAQHDDGVQIIDMTDPAAPMPVAAISDDMGGFTELEGAFDVAIAQISGRTYAAVISISDDGVQIIDMTDPAAPVPVAAISDDMGGFTELDGARGIDTVQISGRTYAVVAAWADDGLQVIDMTDPAAPVPVAAISDGLDGFTKLDGARGIDTVQISGRTYAVVAAVFDGVQVIDIDRIGSSDVVDEPISKGGFYTNLDAVIEITDYQRTEYNDNSLIRITAQITNQEDVVIMGPTIRTTTRTAKCWYFWAEPCRLHQRALNTGTALVMVTVAPLGYEATE